MSEAFPAYDFHADLKRGQKGEAFAEALLLSDDINVEVKTDFKWKETQNIYIELECYHQSTGKYELSGLNVTTADYWAFVLGKSVLFTKVDCLKRTVELFGREVECVNSGNPSKGRVITPQQLIEMEWRRSK